MRSYLAGDVVAVRSMFQSGEASPYYVHGNATPLEVQQNSYNHGLSANMSQLAILSGSYDLVEYLLRHKVIDGHQSLDSALRFLVLMLRMVIERSGVDALASRFSGNLPQLLNSFMEDVRLDTDCTFADGTVPDLLYSLSLETTFPLLSRKLSEMAWEWTVD